MARGYLSPKLFPSAAAGAVASWPSQQLHPTEACKQHQQKRAARSGEQRVMTLLPLHAHITGTLCGSWAYCGWHVGGRAAAAGLERLLCPARDLVAVHLNVSSSVGARCSMLLVLMTAWGLLGSASHLQKTTLCSSCGLLTQLSRSPAFTCACACPC